MQGFIKTIINAIQAWTTGKIKESIRNSIADWNENDINKDSYIKNKPFGETTKLIEIIPEQSFIGGDFDDFYTAYNPKLFDIKENTKYKIIFNDINYYVNSDEHRNIQDNNCSCGILDGIILWPKELGQTITFALYEVQEIVHKLDPKYLNLPTNIATTDDVQEAIKDAETQSNWDQEDEAAVDFIINKPFYVSYEPTEDMSYKGYAAVSNTNYIISNADSTVRALLFHLDKCYTNTNQFSSTGYQLSYAGVNDDGQKYFTSFVSGPNRLFVVTIIDSSHIALSCPELFSNQRCSFFIHHPIFKEVIYPLDRKFVPYFMDKENPNGTGSFSINRKPNSIIGTYSSAIGESVTAYHRATNVIGRFNDYPADYYTEDAVGEVYNETHSEGIHYPYSKSYTFNSETGKYTLVEPMSTSLREIPTGNYVVLNGTRDINRDPNAQGSSIVLIQSSGRYSTNVQRIQGIKYTAIPHVHSVDSTGRYVHIVGNGNKQFPSNAHTLDWEGNAWYQGDVYVGGAGQDDGEVLAKMSEVIPIPTTAAVGQTIAVKAVDENGKPTEWEAVDVGIDGYATTQQLKQVEDKIPDQLADLQSDTSHRTVTDSEKQNWNNKSNFSGNYNDLRNKPTIPTVPTNVSAFSNDKGYITNSDIPSSLPASDVYSWAKQPNKPSYTKSEVGLGNVDNVKQYSANNPPPYPVTSVNGQTGAVDVEPKGTAASAVSTHNTNTDAHNDIRLLIEGLTTRLNTLADSDDTTLDQLSEVVEYIKDNRELIEGVTTNKISVADIIDNLTTSVTNKPLSAKQGVQLKSLIDAIKVPTKLSELSGDSTHRTVTDSEKNSWNAKSNFSGSYNDLTNKPTIPQVPANVSAFNNDAGYMKSTEQQAVIDAALAQAKASGEFDGENGNDGLSIFYAPSQPSTEPDATLPSLSLSNINLNGRVLQVGDFILVFDGSLYEVVSISQFSGSCEVQQIANIKGPPGNKGDKGQRGFNILKVTTAPSSYTTATGGFTPTYRIALSTVKTQSKATEVLVGDTLAYNYYQYPVGYVDGTYVYLGARTSIRGATGAPYTLTDADKNTIAAAVKDSLTTEEWTFTLKDGSTVTKAVLLG